MKFFSLINSNNSDLEQVSLVIERLLEGNTFIEQNSNLRIVDLFFFC